MIHELDTVVLTIDVMEHGLQIGDVGTVVVVVQDGQGYVVEFMTLNRDTVAVVPLEADKVRTVQDDEIAHVRRCALVA